MEGKCWLHGISEDGLRIKDSDVAGKGLFAAKDFKKDQFVCTMEGTPISIAAVNKMSDKEAEYITQITKTKAIDSRKPTSCYGRFINSHYKTHRTPNVRFCNVPNSHQNHFSVRAIKNIKSGTELLAHYGGKGGYYKTQGKRT
jgi:hypothetical protein